MTAEKPLATIHLDHAAIELWPGHVRTVFKDGATVPAAPNGTETILDTAIHELLHHVHAQVKTQGESFCLRAVAQGDGKRWTPERLEEESFAYPAGKLLAPIVAQLLEAYGAVGSKYAQPATRDPIAQAAMVLLKAHMAARKKPLAERSPRETDLAYLGRNRLIRIGKGKYPAEVAQ